MTKNYASSIIALFTQQKEQGEETMSGAENNSSRKRPLDTDSTSTMINLTVHSQDGLEVFFKIKRSIELKKLLVAFCKKRFFDYNTMQFLYNGERFSHKLSPDDLNMGEDDQIDAMWHQGGGACVGK